MSAKKAPKWTDAQHAKFAATMKAKAAAKKAEAAGEQSIPLDAIPDRPPRAPGAKRKPGNGAVQLHAEVNQRSGELWLVIGALRVPLVLR